MLTRLNLRAALELVGVDPRAFWGVNPITPDRMFWPTLAESPEGTPTRMEFRRAVEAAERLVLGSENLWITSPTMETPPGPRALSAGQPVATWTRRAVRKVISGSRAFIGTAQLTPLNERVLIDWVNPYQDFVTANNGQAPLLQEVVVTCPQCREAYNPFPILAYVDGQEVSLVVEPYEVIAPSTYVDVRGPVSADQSNWGTVEVWGYIGTELEYAGELLPKSTDRVCGAGQADKVFVYSGVERPEIWLRLTAAYMPNVCGASHLFRQWAQPVEGSATPWGASFGAYEAYHMRATIRE